MYFVTCLKCALYPFGKSAGIQPFLIVFLSRTGSNLLASTLDSHPEILCHHEVFRMDSIHMASSLKTGKVRMDVSIFEGRDQKPFAFLKRVYSTGAVEQDGSPCPIKAIGIKFSHYQGKWLLLALLLNRNIKKIVVRRDNVLASFVSLRTAAQSGRWVKFAERDYSGQPAEPAKVPIDLKTYFRYVRRVDGYHLLLKVIFAMTFQRVFQIEYGEIARGHRLVEVQNFLKVEQVPDLQAGTSRQAARPLADRIENIEEVRQAFRPGSRHEKWLLADQG